MLLYGALVFWMVVLLLILTAWIAGGPRGPRRPRSS